MGYAIQSGKQEPTLEYDVTDAATGAPMRVTVLSGVAGIANEKTGMRVYRAGQRDEGEVIGFYVPGMAPLPAGVEPVLVPEVFIAQTGVHLVELHTTVMHGIGEVSAQVVADPNNAGARWIYLSFRCFGNEPMVVRYRVTVYRPRP